MGNNRIQPENIKAKTTKTSSREMDTSQFNRTVGELNRAVKALESAAQGFEQASSRLTINLTKISKDFSDKQQSSNEEADKQREEDLDKLDKSLDKHLTKGQVIGGALIKSFETVGGYIVGRYKDAAMRVINNYNESLTEITTRQQWSNHQYTKELKEATSWIKNKELTKQFSQIDWTKSLQTALSMGMRDIGDSLETQYATNIAQQNLITNKLLPQLSTNSRTYTRASKLLGESLSQNITAIGKYTERLYGGEGLDDNSINNFMDTILTDVMYAGAKQGWSEEQTSGQLADIYGSYQQFANQYGATYAEDMMGALKDYLEAGDMSGNIDAVNAASRSGIKWGDSSTINSANVAKFMEEYTYLIGRNPMSPGLYGKVYPGASSEDKKAVTIGDTYSEKVLTAYSDIMGAIDKNAEYNKGVKELTEGYYQSKDAQVEKEYENKVANFADDIAEKVPDVQGKLSVISRLINIWFTAWSASMLLGGRGGGSGGGIPGLANKALSSSSTLSGTFGGATSLGGVFENAGKASALLKSGATLGETAGTSIGGTSLGAGSTALGVANLAAGPAMLAAGLIWGGVDAYNAGKRASDNGMSTEQVIGQGARSFFTGSGTAGMTNAQKADYYAQNGYKIDWKSVVKNGAKGALIGGGVGTIGAGLTLGASTAIGAGIGAAVGAATNAIDQAVDMKHFKDLAKESEKSAEALNMLNDAANNYKVAVENSTTSMDALDVLQNRKQHTEQDQIAALESLKKLYPEYLGNVTDLSQWDESYIDVIKAKIEYEKQKTEAEYSAALDDTSVGDISEYQKDTLNQTSFDFAKWASTEGASLEGQEWNKAAREWVENYAEKHNVEGGAQTVYKRLRDNYGSGVINYNALASPGEEYSFDYNSAKEKGDYSNRLETSYNMTTKLFDDKWTNVIQSGYVALTTAVANKNVALAQKAADDLTKELNELWDQLKGPQKNEFKARYKGLPNLDEYYRYAYPDGDVTPPQYKLGTDFVKQGLQFVSRNLQPAFLDYGEAVLTAPDAERLRNMAGPLDLSNFINLWYNARNLGTATPENVTVSLDPVVDAIKTQTDELQDSLKKIITLVASLVPDPLSGTHHNPNLISYQGA